MALCLSFGATSLLFPPQVVLEFVGENVLSALRVSAEASRDDEVEERLIAVDGAFVAIGHVPNTKLFDAQKDARGKVETALPLRPSLRF